jgi:hypothetical protein
MTNAHQVALIADAFAEARGGTREEHLANAALFVKWLHEIRGAVPGGDLSMVWSHLIPSNQQTRDRWDKYEALGKKIT